jgi:S-adenosylmethionine:tRNA ribosyltransferase-isomerase
MKEKIKTSDLNILIPNSLIADRPATVRDESRLLVVYKNTGHIEHKLFKDIIYYFNENDVLILNNSKVYPSRFYGKKENTGSQVEVILLRIINTEEKTFNVLVNPAKKIRIGNKIYFEKNNKTAFIAEVIDITSSKGRTLQFLSQIPYHEFKKLFDSICEPCLPKYIPRYADRNDFVRYQTIFAKHYGSIIAPSSGFHFTHYLLRVLQLNNVKFAEITLHLGYTNFSTIIQLEDFSKHKIYSEKCIINQSACDIVNKAIKDKRKVCAVGTSAMQAIESSVSAKNQLLTYNGWTNKFIFPPYKFRIANSMITNFHTPKSPFFMTILALLGYDLTLHVYHIAVKEQYKFYSYGDALLIL